MTLRIGSLCSGVGALDLAVESVIDAELAWYAQYEPPNAKGKPDAKQYAARIMAHRFPGVPNHGDVAAIDYAAVERVDILTAGWPCQDMSLAGKRAGMLPGTRSGLWTHVARAVEALRPSLVLLENVRSLTSARAHCDLEFCPWCMGDPGEDAPPCSGSASTWVCSRRPGRSRVRCGVAVPSRRCGRNPSPAVAGVRPRLARRQLLPRFPVGVFSRRPPGTSGATAARSTRTSAARSATGRHSRTRWSICCRLRVRRTRTGSGRTGTAGWICARRSRSCLPVRRPQRYSQRRGRRTGRRAARTSGDHRGT